MRGPVTKMSPDSAGQGDVLNKGIQYRYLLALFSLSFMIRMLFFTFIHDHPERILAPDSSIYIELAESLLHFHAFPSIFRTPLYPSFLALISGVFGHFPEAAVIAQYCLDSLTAVIVVFLFLELFGRVKYACGAGVLYAVTPFAVFYSNMVLSETLFTFIMAVSVYGFIVYLDRRQMRYLLASSVLLGAGVLCRPIALYLPLLLVPFILAGGLRLKDRLVHCAIFLAAFCTILMPWYIHNYRQHAYWGVSTVQDMDMFYYEAAAALMIKDNAFTVIRPGINDALYTYQAYLWKRVEKKYGWKEQNFFEVGEDIAKVKILRREGETIVKKNIPVVLLSHTVGIGRTICPYPPHFGRLTGFHAAILEWLAFLIDAVITGLSFFGIMTAVRRSSNIRAGRIAVVALLFVLFYFTFIPGIMGYPRFKVPVLPLMCIFASFGLERIRGISNPEKIFREEQAGIEAEKSCRRLT